MNNCFPSILCFILIFWVELIVLVTLARGHRPSIWSKLRWKIVHAPHFAFWKSLAYLLGPPNTSRSSLHHKYETSTLFCICCARDPSGYAVYLGRRRLPASSSLSLTQAFHWRAGSWCHVDTTVTDWEHFYHITQANATLFYVSKHGKLPGQ
jgi:hypothetical protein